jgi:nascent polypeptide-associated complex subunit alpha
MFPGIDPKKMQAVMKQMGISQEDIDAIRVIIECSDKDIVIDEPSVVKVKMQGQTSFQISGNITEKEKSNNHDDYSEEDIETIIEKTGCTKDKAIDALKKYNGDLTEAILSLS